MASLTIAVGELGGFPFLDDGFRRDRLLTGVACARWRRFAGSAQPRTDDLRRMLVPEEALRVRQLDLRLDLPSSELSSGEQRQVRDALRVIAAAVPGWAELLKVPWRFRGLPADRGAIGASTFAWPQHVFLSEAAFASDHELAEQIVHELSHGWLYLIEELSPLQHAGCDRLVTLPSGTSERGVSELLGALHVVANLRRLWSSLPVAEDLRHRRLEDLRTYYRGALAALPGVESCLTPEGRTLARRLEREDA